MTSNKNRRSRYTALAGLSISAVLMTACSSSPDVPGSDGSEGSSSGKMSVGVLLPFTGEYSWVGENVDEVVQMIINDEVNPSGGIGGRDVVIVRGDEEGTVDGGVLAARKLANTDQVLAFIGPTSLSFTGVRQVIVDTKTPMVSPAAGTVELDSAGEEYFHRAVPSDSLGGKAIAKAISEAEELLKGESFETVSLMVGDAPALVSFEEPIQAAMEQYGTPLAKSVRYSVNRESYRSEVSDILGDDPDMIILVGSPADSAKVMAQAQQNGYDGSWFVTQDQTNAEYIELAGADVVEGVYGLQEAAPEAAADLRETFAEALGHDPDIFQTNAYDAVNLIVLAMYLADKEDGEVTRATVDARLEDVANPEDGDVVVTSWEEGKAAIDAGDGIDYQGLSGPVDFDEFGNITAPFDILQVQSGEFVPVSVIQADELQ